jgi:lipoyl(octanoyl) transferase
MVARNQISARAVAQGAIGEIVFFEPVAPVYALGRRAQDPEGRAQIAFTLDTCRAHGIAIVDVDRGGLGTLHAPGQIVAFLAVRCSRWDARRLCEELLSGIAQLARAHGLDARCDLGDDVGVWLGDAKLASLGLRLMDGVALHGIALNCSVDSRLTSGLVLCGKPWTTFANLDSVAVAEQADLAAWSEKIARHWQLAAAAPRDDKTS